MTTKDQPEIIRYENEKFYDVSQGQQNIIDLTTPMGQNIQQAATTQFGSDLSTIEGKDLRWNADTQELAQAGSSSR